jgi:flagellar protein FliL
MSAITSFFAERREADIMRKTLSLLLLLFTTCLSPLTAIASEGGGEGEAAAVPSGIGYYTLDPEFITNFITTGPNLGYVRVKVDLMVDNAADIEILKKHDPLLRDAINTLLGAETQDDVKSQEGREKTRLACKAKIEELLTKEEGRKVIRDLLFTNFLYQ